MNQIKNKDYSNPQEFYEDFMLMFQNAQDYNMPGLYTCLLNTLVKICFTFSETHVVFSNLGSQVHTDAIKLQELFQKEYEQFIVTYNPIEDNRPESEEEKNLKQQQKGNETTEQQINLNTPAPVADDSPIQQNNMEIEKDDRIDGDDDPEDADFQITDEESD
jgi:hypothetical protein